MTERKPIDSEHEYQLEHYSREVRGFRRAVTFFSKLSYVLWGAFFASAANAYHLVDWIYLVSALALLAVGSYWWSHYLDRVLLLDAENALRSAEYDLEYREWGRRRAVEEKEQN